MGLTAGPQGPAARQKKLEDRLEALEAPRSQVTHPVTGDTVRGRATQVAGVPIEVITEKGLEAPGIAGTSIQASQPTQTTTSSSWSLLWVVSFPAVTTDALQLRMRVASVADAASSTSLRVQAYTGLFPFGTQETTTVAEEILSVGPGAVTTYYDLEWIHGLALSTTPCYFFIEGQVTTGTGSVTVTQPYYAYLRGSDMMSAPTTDGF